MYQLYTLPNCAKCDDIKSYLYEGKIDYQECSLTQRENKRVVGELIKTRRDDMKYVQGGPLLPIFLKRGESGIEAIAQDLEGVKSLVTQNGD
jgi:glutaredoxin